MVCGKVCTNPTERTNKDGKSFISFSMDVDLPVKNGGKYSIRVSVSKDCDVEPNFTTCAIGTKLEVSGTLLFRKRADNLYFNLYAESISEAASNKPQGIKGKMEFRGKVGKSIEEKTDKNGKSYLQFSAMSSEKVDDGFENIWVLFLQFNAEKEDWLVPECKVEAKGNLEMSVYKERVGFTCIADEVKPYTYQSNK